jgi:uncharacterized membrane protein
MINDERLRLVSAILAVIGLLDSLYLTWAKLTHTAVICGGSSECQTVNDSPYAEIAGIPISLLGMGAYIVILVLLYLDKRGRFWDEYSKIFVFGITLAGVLYSAYLTFIEVAVIYAICPYCVVSAVVMLLLFIIAIVRLVQSP